MLKCMSSASYSECPRRDELAKLFLADPSVQKLSRAHLAEAEKIRKELAEQPPGYLIPDEAATHHLLAFFRRLLLPLIPLDQRFFASHTEECFAMALANTPIPALPATVGRARVMTSRPAIIGFLCDAIESGAEEETIAALADKLGGWETVRDFTDDFSQWFFVQQHFSTKRCKTGD